MIIVRTLIVPTEFETIQAAVDAAEAGDEVLILPGFYQERVVIQKDDITVRGESFPVEVLGDGIGFGFTVEGNNIKLINLDIKGFQVGIAFRGNNYLIEEVISDEHLEFGIAIFGDNGIITKGSFSLNESSGIIISGKNNKVINNRILNNREIGIGSFYAPLEEAVISDNVIIARESADVTSRSIGIAFDIEFARGNLVKDNYINTGIGVISNGEDNRFINNTIAATGRTAVTLNSNRNEMCGNFISQCPNGIVINGEGNRIFNNVLSIVEAVGITVLKEENCIIENVIVKSKVGIVSLRRNRIAENHFECVCTEIIIK